MLYFAKSSIHIYQTGNFVLVNIYLFIYFLKNDILKPEKCQPASNANLKSLLFSFITITEASLSFLFLNFSMCTMNLYFIQLAKSLREEKGVRK